MNDPSFGRRTVRGLVIAAVILPAFLLSLSCRRAEAPSFTRFIDILGRDNVIDSPILDLAADPKEFARTNPSLAEIVEKYPLLDLGAGKNPWLLKKKMAMGPFQENAILASPRSLFRFKVKVPPNGILEFSYGIYWGKDPARNAKGSSSAEFLVRTKTRGQENFIFRRKLSLSSERNLLYNHKKIDLSPLSGQTITLEFITRGDQDSLALWFNPVLYKPRPDPRNVILISLDTLRADHLGCYGYSRPTSPNMDKLAAESVVFRNTYAASPWTLPSHVSILTGLDCLNHGVLTSAQKMDPRDGTLADYLRREGYETAAFTGGGFVSGLFGMNKGFETFRSHATLSDPRQAGALTRTIVPWIEENSKKSFFLFLHTYQIHNPYFTPRPYDTMFLDADATFHSIDMGPMRYNHENRFKPPESPAFTRNIIALYDSEIRYTDEALIAPLLAELKKLGLYDRTMIVITADHGEEFYEKKGWLHTHNVYEPILKVPLIIKYPGSRDAGKRVDRMARITDIMPTILEEMGVDFPRGELDGRGLGPLVRGSERGQERMFRSELAGNVARDHIPHKRAVSQGMYKVIVNDPYTPKDLAFFAYPPPDTGKLEIFDLSADPGETKNLALTRPDLARRLLTYLEDKFKPGKKAGKGAGPASEMNEEVKEELKALGYIR